MRRVDDHQAKETNFLNLSPAPRVSVVAAHVVLYSDWSGPVRLLTRNQFVKWPDCIYV
jgi:hypothetical protein